MGDNLTSAGRSLEFQPEFRMRLAKQTKYVVCSSLRADTTHLRRYHEDVAICGRKIRALQDRLTYANGGYEECKHCNRKARKQFIIDQVTERLTQS